MAEGTPMITSPELDKRPKICLRRNGLLVLWWWRHGETDRFPIYGNPRLEENGSLLVSESPVQIKILGQAVRARVLASVLETATFVVSVLPGMRACRYHVTANSVTQSDSPVSASMKPSVRRAELSAQMLATLGIVYGDIGTSPLYALRECFHGRSALPVTPGNVYGVLSLVTWSLLLVVSLKYLVFVLRADNDGEGGILSLMALALRHATKSRRKYVILMLGLFGAGLLYGDGVITPAISVLSAVEGLRIVAPGLEHYLVPIAVSILIVLFVIQRSGTAHVGRMFGPIMIVWFATLAFLGSDAILHHLSILRSISPHYALMFFWHNQLSGFLTLGTVFLVVTGGEALYADMGHFGAKPIRLVWFALVLPALLINYYGQGALLLSEPHAVENPFFFLAPNWLQLPLVVLATVATSIASQAVISGAFSLTYQGVQLGVLPRLMIVHTSRDERGQVYVPLVNWGLLIAVISLVVFFRSSSNLAGAYGIAVTTTMVITTLLLYEVARRCWGWSPVAAMVMVLTFVTIDLGFFFANMAKIVSGGWLPLAIGLSMALLMATWRRGRELVAEVLQPRLVEANLFFTAEIESNPPTRVPLPAVYLSPSVNGIPLTLVRNIRHNRTLHQPAAILSIITTDRPYVPLDERIEFKALGHDIYRITAKYGFKQKPNVANILAQCRTNECDFTGPDTTFFLGHISFDVTDDRRMRHWRKQLFVWLSNNSRDASRYFGIPVEQVVEIGMRLKF